MAVENKFKYWLYFKTCTGTWLPSNKRFSDKTTGKMFIKLIKEGYTIYRSDLTYKIGE